jgi:uncharacterized protein
MVDVRRELVPTSAGNARVSWFRAAGAGPTLALGHGAGVGIEAADLTALATELPLVGITVALVEQSSPRPGTGSPP